MSPVGGVGINLAVQDAVATANLLGSHLTTGPADERVLDRVRQRRLFAARFIQRFQIQVQNRVIRPVLAERTAFHAPLFLKFIGAFPWLQSLIARVIGLGVTPEHVRHLETLQIKNGS
jgi:2-polyprenyl-6-methoxyphenol hydroxylase-like FAD-dependent oxidoreductase